MFEWWVCLRLQCMSFTFGIIDLNSTEWIRFSTSFFRRLVDINIKRKDQSTTNHTGRFVHRSIKTTKRALDNFSCLIICRFVRSIWNTFVRTQETVKYQTLRYQEQIFVLTDESIGGKPWASPFWRLSMLTPNQKRSISNNVKECRKFYKQFPLIVVQAAIWLEIVL